MMKLKHYRKLFYYDEKTLQHFATKKILSRK